VPGEAQGFVMRRLWAELKRRSRLRRAAALVIGVMVLADCGGAEGPATIPLERSGAALAADGTITTDREGGNTLVTVEVEYMAPPERVAADAAVYVVWIRPTAADARPQNLGVLELSSERTGRLDTITPHREFEIFVTAEPTGTVARPSGPSVMRARVSEND
jgi:hypothetical protein